MRVSPTRALAIVVGVVAVLASPCPAIAQNVSSAPLAVRMPDDATNADVELIVSIATRLGVPLGFEAVGALSERVSMPYKTQSSRDAPKIVSVRPRPRDVRGLTLRQALDAAVASDRRYEWREMDGVVVVRPRAAWGDRDHPLLRPVTAADLDAAGLPTDVDGRTVFDALNAAVRAHERFQWSLRSEISTILLDRGRAVTVAQPVLRLDGPAGWREIPLRQRDGPGSR
jgi:hypothetical protein